MRNPSQNLRKLIVLGALTIALGAAIVGIAQAVGGESDDRATGLRPSRPSRRRASWSRAATRSESSEWTRGRRLGREGRETRAEPGDVDE